MDITLWVIAGLLAAAFAAAGLIKLAQPKAKLAESGMPGPRTSATGRSS